MRDLEALSKQESVRIVGIDSGGISGKSGAIVAQMEGSGDSTVCNLIYYTSLSMTDELKDMLEAVAGGSDLSAGDLAGINFLFLHHLTSLYGQIFEETELEREGIDLVGLKPIQVGEEKLPLNPADFSEMIDNIVISRFSISMGNEDISSVPLEGSIFRTLVAEMIEKFQFEDAAYEALGVALFANESFRNENGRGEGKKGGAGGNARAGGNTAAKRAEVVFNGEFYLPR